MRADAPAEHSWGNFACSRSLHEHQTLCGAQFAAGCKCSDTTHSLEVAHAGPTLCGLLIDH